MKKIVLYFLAISMVVFSIYGTAYAIPITTNFGFETGDFSGWNVAGTALAVEDYAGGSRSYTAVYGLFFALLGSGHSTIFQDFTLDAGDTIFGYAAFDANETAGWVNDGASVQILSDIGTQIAMPWYMDTATVSLTIGKNRETP